MRISFLCGWNLLAVLHYFTGHADFIKGKFVLLVSIHYTTICFNTLYTISLTNTLNFSSQYTIHLNLQIHYTLIMLALIHYTLKVRYTIHLTPKPPAHNAKQAMSWNILTCFSLMSSATNMK